MAVYIVTMGLKIVMHALMNLQVPEMFDLFLYHSKLHD